VQARVHYGAVTCYSCRAFFRDAFLLSFPRLFFPYSSLTFLHFSTTISFPQPFSISPPPFFSSPSLHHRSFPLHFLFTNPYLQPFSIYIQLFHFLRPSSFLPHLSFSSSFLHFSNKHSLQLFSSSLPPVSFSLATFSFALPLFQQFSLSTIPFFNLSPLALSFSCKYIL
jgi:hypothetical protein